MVRAAGTLTSGLPRVVWRVPQRSFAQPDGGSQKNPLLYTRGPGCLAVESDAIWRREPDRSRTTDQAHLGAPAWRMHTRAGATNSGLLHSPRNSHRIDRTVCRKLDRALCPIYRTWWMTAVERRIGTLDRFFVGKRFGASAGRKQIAESRQHGETVPSANSLSRQMAGYWSAIMTNCPHGRRQRVCQHSAHTSTLR